MTHISPELWLGRPGMPALLESLGAARGDSRIVGGAVRDWLLDLEVSDIDIATRLSPPQVMDALEKAGIRAVPTGLAHGTVTAVSHGAHYEITTLRRDVETDGRHARVAFTDDWRADAERRDFTINALYAHPFDGTILDFFGGVTDLGQHLVRFIGEPLRRIAEDHLRILRFFRFTARYAESPDPEGLAACAARANDLMALSRERIRDELLKLLHLPDPAPTVGVMLDHAILKPVLPEITADALPRLVALASAERASGVPADGLRRLAALLPHGPEPAGQIGARLKLSNAEKLRLQLACTPTPVPEDPRALAYAIGGEAAIDRLLLTGDGRARHWAAQLAGWTRPRMPVSGKDLIAMGLPPGPQVSRRLAEVEARWIAAGFPDSREKTAAIARAVMGLR